ncbi:MAG: toprim domain-containing protein [Bacteroidales bacterium]|nr:toprim domain-containing protein [Bacteroidales bacterium]
MAEKMDNHVQPVYNDDSIQTLPWNEHIRRRSGMYLGSLGDGSDFKDGLYILLKEIIDNSVDEFTAGFGKEIIIDIDEKTATVRDYGQGIPLGSVIKATSVLNTGGRFDTSVFQKSIGMNGVGTKAVNATSVDFYVCSYRDGEKSWARFSRGELLDSGREPSNEKNGTVVSFTPDPLLFVNYSFHPDIVESMIKNYSYVKRGLAFILNGTTYLSKNGLSDKVSDVSGEQSLYPIIHLEGDDIEVALTHTDNSGINISSYVNGQYTWEGGTHAAALKEAIAKVLMEFYKKNYTPDDCRQGMVAAIYLRIQDPIVEGQQKSKLTSTYMWQRGNGDTGPTVRSYVIDFLSRNLDDYLHVHKDIADAIESKLKDSMKEREEITEIRNSNKKSRSHNVYNENLRDCRYHFCDKETKVNQDFLPKTSIFITEGKSASGTVTKARNANYQAVFSVRGKSKNSYQSSEAKVLENVELKNLVAALGIGDSIEGLRYNKVIIATDADDDGMHIRLLLATFFLKYYRELVLDGHLYVLETPLFRIKSKKGNRYCYSVNEKNEVLNQLNAGKEKIEITRFKGLGEINESEFCKFIGEEMRLSPLTISSGEDLHKLLSFYMGKNTNERQKYIIHKLRSEEELEGIELN